MSLSFKASISTGAVSLEPEQIWLRAVKAELRTSFSSSFKTSIRARAASLAAGPIRPKAPLAEPRT